MYNKKQTCIKLYHVIYNYYIKQIKYIKHKKLYQIKSYTITLIYKIIISTDIQLLCKINKTTLNKII